MERLLHEAGTKVDASAVAATCIAMDPQHPSDPNVGDMEFTRALLEDLVRGTRMSNSMPAEQIQSRPLLTALA